MNNRREQRHSGPRLARCGTVNADLPQMGRRTRRRMPTADVERHNSQLPLDAHEMARFRCPREPGAGVTAFAGRPGNRRGRFAYHGKHRYDAKLHRTFHARCRGGWMVIGRQLLPIFMRMVIVELFHVLADHNEDVSTQ